MPASRAHLVLSGLAWCTLCPRRWGRCGAQETEEAAAQSPGGCAGCCRSLWSLWNRSDVWDRRTGGRRGSAAAKGIHFIREKSERRKWRKRFDSLFYFVLSPWNGFIESDLKITWWLLQRLIYSDSMVLNIRNRISASGQDTWRCCIMSSFIYFLRNMWATWIGILTRVAAAKRYKSALRQPSSRK